MKITPGKIAALTLGASAGALAMWAYRDYRKWLALGPGGLPYNFNGWMTTTWMRLQQCDPLDTFGLADLPGVPEDVACLHDLPSRRGHRPSVGVHPVPHRQLDQLPDDAMKPRIEALFDATVERHVGLVEYQLSYFEKRNRAITLREPESGHADARASRGEIGHVHPSDGSMHMILSRADARAVIESEWGERHPLAGIMLALPATYLLIYPPREKVELLVTGRILDAAIAHMALLPVPEGERTTAQ